MKVKSLLFLLMVFLFTSNISYGQRGIFGLGFKTLTGSGNVKTETRDLKGFTKVETNGSINVFVKKADAFKVTIEADDNLLPYIVPVVHGDLLVVRTKDNFSYRSSKRLNVYISMPQLTALATKGSGSITCESKFNGDEFVAQTQGSGSINCSFDGKNIKISTQGSGGVSFSGSVHEAELDTHGSGGIKAQLDAESTQLDVSGSGSITISGTTNDLVAQVHGSGSIDGYRFLTKHANASTQGSGSCNLSVSESLNGKTQGSGSINYKGSAKVVSSETLGSGKIRKQ